MNKYRHIPSANGFGQKHRKLDKNGRAWKNDAVKWAPQALVVHAGLNGMEDGDLLAWFDADVETTRAVPKHWINVLLNGGDLACLFRPQMHPEIGFWAVRVNPTVRKCIQAFARFYESGEVFNIREWHSAYVFNAAVKCYPELKVVNLNRSNNRGHPWTLSPLAQYTIHKKGKLKDG